MPICIECRYPVPQLYHVLHSTSKPSTTPAQTPSTISSLHTKKLSSGSQATAGGSAGLTNVNEGSRGGGEAKKNFVGGEVRLTQCPRCKRFADKYVEHDFVVLFIDLVLVKPQVYRHLLFNRLARDDNALDPSIIRLGILLLLFDVYLTWTNIESLPTAQLESSPILRLPMLAQYLFFLSLSLSTTLAQHLTIRTLARLPPFRPSSHPLQSVQTGVSNTSAGSGNNGTPGISNNTLGGVGPTGGGGQAPGTLASNSTTLVGAAGAGTAATPPLSTTSSTLSLPLLPLPSASPSTAHSHTPSQPLQSPSPSLTPQHPFPPSPFPASLSTALFVSSCMRLFPLLMVVWHYSGSSREDNIHNNDGHDSGVGIQVARGVGWLVALQNVEALRILLGGGYLRAVGLVGAGKVVEYFVGKIVRGVGGLEG